MNRLPGADVLHARAKNPGESGEGIDACAGMDHCQNVAGNDRGALLIFRPNFPP